MMLRVTKISIFSKIISIICCNAKQEMSSTDIKELSYKDADQSRAVEEFMEFFNST